MLSQMMLNVHHFPNVEEEHVFADGEGKKTHATHSGQHGQLMSTE
jgi:uncharacterized protein YhfF